LQAEFHTGLNRVTRDADGPTINVSVVLTGEQAAAVEGWRVANRIDSQSDAVRELVRIGLLSEIGRIYRMIAGGSNDDDIGEVQDVPG
jgi:Arc/MetJ-type ribon-helix-helix transcriptional regulator